MVTPADPFHLERFVEAQVGVYERVREELARGWKEGHWMWFIFPQMRGLGESYLSKKFGISDLAEAEAYLNHPILGPRLRECTRLVRTIHDSTARQIFGSPDDLKLRSCMTLFAHATSDNALFLDVLRKYFHSQFDPLTLDLLKRVGG